MRIKCTDLAPSGPLTTIGRRRRWAGLARKAVASPRSNPRKTCARTPSFDVCRAGSTRKVQSQDRISGSWHRVQDKRVLRGDVMAPPPRPRDQTAEREHKTR
jgi:hypothetical protein